MKTNCERCKEEKDCTFYGRPSDPDADKAQNGEWLCAECVGPREQELDDAIARLRRILED